MHVTVQKFSTDDVHALGGPKQLQNGFKILGTFSQKSGKLVGKFLFYYKRTITGTSILQNQTLDFLQTAIPFPDYSQPLHSTHSQAIFSIEKIEKAYTYIANEDIEKKNIAIKK